MKIKIDGRELVGKNLDNARVRDIVELQRQTGWKGQELQEQVQAADMGFGMAIALFLTLRNAGFSKSWDEVLDIEISEFEMIKDPEDTQRELDAAAVESPDPQDARPGSSEDSGAPAAKKPGRASTRSS